MILINNNIISPTDGDANNILYPFHIPVLILVSVSFAELDHPVWSMFVDKLLYITIDTITMIGIKIDTYTN